jgi:hypothetical protein
MMYTSGRRVSHGIAVALWAFGIIDGYKKKNIRRA